MLTLGCGTSGEVPCVPSSYLFQLYLLHRKINYGKCQLPFGSLRLGAANDILIVKSINLFVIFLKLVDKVSLKERELRAIRQKEEVRPHASTLEKKN